MGGLAPGLDLLDGSCDETSPDLPLWYAALVEPRASAAPRAVAEPEPPSSGLHWRASVARWPIERRQAWGDLANALQDAGFGWKDAERKAFEQIASCYPPMKG